MKTREWIAGGRNFGRGIGGDMLAAWEITADPIEFLGCRLLEWLARRGFGPSEFEPLCRVEAYRATLWREKTRRTIRVVRDGDELDRGFRRDFPIRLSLRRPRGRGIYRALPFRATVGPGPDSPEIEGRVLIFEGDAVEFLEKLRRKEER